MAVKESVYRVLLVSSSESFSKTLCGLLPSGTFTPVTVVNSAGAARRSLLEQPVDLLLINSPLSDESGTRLAVSVANESDTGVLLFAKNEWYEEISSQLMNSGVLTVSKPSTRQTILQSLRLLCASRERLRRLENRASDLEEKLAEIRLVDRAKWKLVSRYSYTEEVAHRYIEKLAMDRCVSKRTIALEILDE